MTAKQQADQYTQALAEADRYAAWVRDTRPPLWAALYKGLRTEGFSHEDAMELVGEYIHATNH